MLNVKIKTKPITKLLHYIRIPFFYVGGGHFRITAQIKNFDSVRFQGGVITILIRYAFGNLTERIQMNIGAIEPKKEVKLDFEGHDIWGVLAQGHCLFWANIIDNTNKPIDLCNEDGKPLEKQSEIEATEDGKQIVQKPVYRSHIHTFHSLGFGELCALLALGVNTLAFLTNIILFSIVNNEKLSVLWNTLVYTVPLSIIVILSFLVIAALYLVYVYVIYDRYGLYK